MVFACRESFLSFKSFPCRPLTSILCHIPRPCRSLRRRHLFFSEAEPGSCSFIYSVGFFCKFPAASSLQTPTISPISQSSTSHMRTKHLQRNIFIPTEVRHCVRRKLSCPTQIRLAHFFVHKQFPKFVIAYVHGSIPLLCCFIVSAFVLFLPTFRHLFISGLVLCFSIEQNSRIQLHFGPPKNSALTQKPRFCLRCLKRMRIFSAFFFEQPLNLIDNRKILFR